ncbi:putative E3 ubiquitin ligase [Aspergillus steynii IBT 23096]|uniref:Putative E3 ubiquitin ligase n=1 Tax=Aspergillus steynii IBT 23096 TaxID=1392250 RepID=A0A2I2G555_9EURO|nr:putative E3 ubiquitin ligase [Aspergillus steynii IBT 23096]PLB48004.1 putative E3 ubiquitin ligase [Aspergillus steynii IBT 23096]
MGQSSSTQRDHRHDNHLEHILSLQAARGRVNSDADMNNGRGIEQTGDYEPQSGPEINNSGIQTSSSGQPTESWHPLGSPEQPGTSRHMASIQEENGSQYESSQREYRSAIFARMAARRQSTMSRLGSRILPNSVIRGLLSSEEETPAEGHAHRHGVVSRTLPRSEVNNSSSRFSPFSSFGSRGISRRRSTRGPYFIPRSDPGLIPDTTHSSTFFDPTTDHAPENTRGSWRRSARLHRVRHSLSSPITHMFGQPSSNMIDHPSSVQQSPMDSMSNEPPHTFLPHPGPMDTRMDFDEPHELDSVEPAVGSTRPTSPMSSQSAQGPTGLRQFPGLLRARSSRAMRREEQTPLSRVLQLAAAAIAAQLSGTTGPVMPNIQALGNDGLDGSLENFIQSLQHATSTQTTPNDSPGPSGDTGNGPATPVNFLRVFRFANSENPGPLGMPNRSAGESDNPGRSVEGIDLENPVDGPEGRTVTLVVVGVRSVPSGNGPGSDQQANGGPGLDALLRLPFLSPGNLSRGPENGPSLPRAEARPRFAAPNRHSVGSPSTLTTNGDTPQLQGQQSPSRRMSDTGGRVPLSSVPSVLSESPPGPHPPPSTPAEPGLSAVSSGASTPSRRPSSASMMPPSVLPQLDENRAMQPTVEVDENPPFAASHQRRRSDSEYARHRDLGSGAVRRNGVVEPDHAPPPAGRSWLIYVVGTNLSENHPAFATPSLFTDNPTYEDMILLSSLLGPVKPPVATQEELSSAGGLFRLVEYGGSLTAEGLDGAGTIQVPDGDRCLICLSDYEAAEELRQLNKCKHVFHRDCIDQWLTTGRNSCPLCRGQGVVDSSNSDPATTAPSPAAA